jgi:acetyltransferase
VNDEEELVDTLNLFNKAKVSPEIGGTALVTFSGGAGIIMSDKCEEFHIELADFSTGTKEKLRSLLPTFASINNPVDVTGQVTEFPDSLMESIVAILEDEGVEAVVCYMQIGDTFSYRWIPMFSEIANKTNKTFIICWAGASDKTKLLLKESNLCWFPTPTRTIRALRKLIQNKRKKAYKQQTHKVNRLTNLTKIEPHSGIMNEFICKNYLSEYGLSVPKGEIVQDEKGLIEASREIGYPIVLKVVSKDIAHKSDADVIRLNIRSESEVRKAFNEINLNARSLGRNIKIDGVLIEEMIEEGLEVIIGFIQDPLFGPCIMFGLGGVFVEVMKNIVVKQLPLNKEAALEMIKEIKYFHLLQDFRNKGFYDINALAEALVRVSEFCWDHKVWIKEFDINPLVVHKQGQGITVLDSLIIGK